MAKDEEYACIDSEENQGLLPISNPDRAKLKTKFPCITWGLAALLERFRVVFSKGSSLNACEGI